MSICDRCIHDEVCGLEGNHEEAIAFCSEIMPKTGHWKAKSFHELFCDNCGFDFDIMRNDFIDKMHYCPNCGVKMVEPQEREG